MKKIILASNSPQRRNLMNILGFPYEIIPSNADEKTQITTSCAGLVKQNALIKARDVASRLKSGIVIGADTVVFVGGKRMIGKPKDMAEAKANLKLLFSRPHWVYTGVALIDAKTNKTLFDYERTRVHMLHLSDEEIDRYYRKMSPLDKAGGFDIEGNGSAFIHRIEGCYTNVIGLPIAKLGIMLKKFGVSILMLFLAVGLSSCTTEYNLATQKQETLMYGTDKEVSIGDSIAHSINEHYKFVDDVDLNQKVQKILDKIVAVCDRKDVVYFIKIIDEDSINAVSLPGGYIYIFRELTDKVKGEADLAGVIAHEVGHITARHSMKKLQASYGAMVLQAMSMATRNAQVVNGVGIALDTMFVEYSQADEFEADRLGVKYLRAAGYDPQSMTTVLQKLKDEEMKSELHPKSYWRTHPHLTERMAAVNKEINGKIGFKDYLNLTGE